MHFHTFPTNPTRIACSHATGSEAFRLIRQRLGDSGLLAVDGMWGVDWDQLLTGLAEAGLSGTVVRTADCLKDPAMLRELFQPWLTENPVFGRICPLPLSVYFDLERLTAAIAAARQQSAVVIVIGPYALGATAADVGVYCDLPREVIIDRQTRAGLSNLGDDRELSAGAKYKNALYVEWPLLEGYGRNLVQRQDSPVTFYLDCKDESSPVLLPLESLRAVVADVASRPLRCKPLFMPGVWGGQRLREVAELPPEWPNCAWDFEIVAPENAITIGLGETALTVPFHLFLWLQARQLMGELVYRQFGEFFPIRVNYLDTMGGTNLSMQVHPHHTYMRQQFGEPIGQDESYYIVEQEPGSKVYLGLQESTTRENLAAAVRKAETESVPFEVPEYVNEWEAKVGDLFLIPAGTVHCSGSNNLVLELSSTPYWYTFKIYDYLRLDLTGKPRPINSAFAFDVIDFTRKTDWVKRHLIPEPVLLRQDAGGAEYHIGSAAMTFYSVNRLHITSELNDETAGGFLLLTVVKGAGVRILSPNDNQPVAEIAYLETFVVPATFGQFRLQAVGDQPCQVVKTYVRR